MKITPIRKAVEALLEDETDCLSQVWLGNTEMNKSFGELDEFRLNVRLLVGEPDEAKKNEERVDQLFEEVPGILHGDEMPDGVSHMQVLSCSGHRLYSAGPGEPPLLGCEWNVQVYAD